MKSPLLKAALNYLKNKTVELYTSYTKIQHPNTDVCVVWGVDGNQLAFEIMSYDYLKYHKFIVVSRGVLPKNKDIGKMLRKMAGESILNIHGLPRVKEEIRTIRLLAFPSIIETLGLKEAYTLIKNWAGDSYVNERIVMHYTLPR